MEGAYSDAVARGVLPKVAEKGTDYSSLSPEQILRRLKKLEQEMFKHARNLEFEEAAKVRDEVLKLRNVGLGLPGA
jgi:excinuclease ABC subunit B